MRFKNPALFLGLFLLLLSRSVIAEDEVSIVGGAAYNIKNEEFRIVAEPFTPEFVTIDLSFIVAYRSVYLKMNYDQSVKDHFLVNNSPGGGGNPDNQSLLFSREDAGITLGYSVLENVSLFMGYTLGETRALGTSYVLENLSGGASTFPADAYFSLFQVKIKETGPFVGVSYSYYLQQSGSLSFSVAYAKLDGELTFKQSYTQLTTQDVIIVGQKANGDADGFSYSLTWTDQFSDDMLYNISIKTTKYKFDAPEIGNDSFDFDDVYNIFSIGFSKFF